MEPRKNIKEFVEKCHTDFWYYPKRALCFALWVFTIMAVFDSFAMNANAETGTVTVSNDTNANYSVPFPGASQPPPGTYPFTYFRFDVTNYSTLTNFTLYDPDNKIVYGQPNEVTTFTITVNGTGHGVASYSQYLKRLQWVFSADTVITGKVFNVSYDNNIFRNLSIPTAGAHGWEVDTANPNANIDSTHPMHPGNLSTYLSGSNNAAPDFVKYFIYSGIFSTGNVITGYNVTYLPGGFYQMDINKSGASAGTKDYLHTQSNASAGYWAEANFNTNSSSVVMPQLDGIYFNVTLAGGNFVDTLINSSGATGIPTPTPTPPPIPEGQDVAIAFDADTYTVGAQGTLTTNTSFSILDISSYRVDFYSNTNPLINQYAIDKSVSSQHFTVQFPSIGAYTANIVKTTPFIGDEIVATDIASAFTGTGSLIVPITVATGKNFTVNYTFDYQPIANNMCGLGGTGIFAIYQPDGSIQAQHYLLNSNELVQGTTYSINMSVPKAGTYILQLRDCNSGVVATSIPFNAVQSTVPPEFNISVSYVNLTTETIYSGDVITGMWGVDNANYSAFPIYYELQNYSTGTILRIPLTGQKGTINQITSGYDLINLMSVTGLIPAGVNKVSLRADTGNSGTELAYENFTFSTVTATGYDISVDTSCVAPYSPVTIHAITPSGAASSVVVWPTSNTGGFGDIVFNISNTTSIVYVPNTVDVYQVSVLSGTNIEKSTYFTSTRASCVGGVPVNTPTPPPGQPPSGNEASQALGTNLLNFMAMPAFWGIILWVLMIFAVATTTKNGNTTALVAFVGANIEAVIGLWDPFTWYVIVITWVIAAIYFTLSRKVVTGGQ